MDWISNAIFYVHICPTRTQEQAETSCAQKLSNPAAGLYNSPLSVKYHTTISGTKTQINKKDLLSLTQQNKLLEEQAIVKLV